MKSTKKISITLSIALMGITISFAQKKRSEGDVFFFQYEYQKAVSAYEKQKVENVLTEQQYLNLADAYFETENFEKATDAYLTLYKKDTLSLVEKVFVSMI